MKNRRRESFSGLHYYTLYQDSPRHWYLKYALGLIPIYTKPPLIKGGCLAEAKAAYWKTRNPEDLIETYTTEMQDRHKEYEDKNIYKRDVEVGIALLDAWYQTWNEEDEKDWETIEYEKEYNLKIGPSPGFDFTVRPDRVVKNKRTGIYFVVDDKSSGWSPVKPIEMAKNDHQLTAYIWALNRVHPEWKINSGIIDVMYSSSRAKVPNPVCNRSEPIIRREDDLKRFEMQLVGLIIEISQKYQALSKYPCWMLFPRAGTFDGMFGCDYEGICNREVKPGTVPVGFKRDDWSNEMEVIKHIPNFDIDSWKLEVRK